MTGLHVTISPTPYVLETPMPTSTRQQLAEAVAEAATAAPTASRAEAVDAILDALAAHPRTLRKFADQQGPPPIPARWPAGTDPAAWLRGACSSGDPLHSAVTAALSELALLRSTHWPRVWQDGDPIPSGTLVEVVLPDHEAEVARAAAEEADRG